MSTKDKLEKLAEAMRRWQHMENATVAQTAKIMNQTDHPLLRLVMEIIQRDSNNHYRVQQLVVDSLETAQVNVPTDELTKIWESIEAHLELERKTVELGKICLESLEGTRSVVQQYLLSYLLADEEKHNKMLSDLDLIKKGMYP